MRKQNKSMVPKKATFTLTQSANIFSKSISTDSEICVRKDGIGCRNNRAESQDEQAQVQNNPDKSPSKLVQSRDVGAHSKDKRDESREQRVQSENERAQTDQRERVPSEHQVAEDQDERGENHLERAENHLERAENQDDHTPIQRDIQNRSANNGTRNSIIQKGVLFNNPRSSSYKSTQTVITKQRNKGF